MTEDDITFMLLGYVGGVITALSCFLMCCVNEINENEEYQALYMQGLGR